MNAPAPIAVGPNAVVTLQAPGGAAVRIGQAERLAVIAGPCQMESRAHALETAAALKEAATRLGIGLVYKTSFDKANRTSGGAARGIGLAGALPVFAEIRESLGLPVLTDVHDARAVRPRSPRLSTCSRSRPSCAARPTFWSPPRRPGGRSTSRRASSSPPGT